MNILYTTDDAFIPQVAASICSVCVNNKSIKNICFYLMSLNVSQENEEKLQEFVESFSEKDRSRSIVFIELNEIDSYFDYEIDTKGWNPIVLARLLLDNLLPENVRRVLYLDGDTIVRRSLKKLWNTDMGESSIGACVEPTCSKKRKEKLGLTGCPYYNAGVLLIDMDNWRKYNTGKQILKYYQKNRKSLFANDQDAINGSQRGWIYTLPPTYNYHNTYDIYLYFFYKQYLDFSFISKKNLAKIKKNPVIIHYLGEERPWRKGNTHRFKADYEKYLSMTPWKDAPMEKGWEIYFICWRIFNVIMKPFPLLRHYIIEKMMPIFLKNRHRKTNSSKS